MSNISLECESSAVSQLFVAMAEIRRFPILCNPSSRRSRFCRPQSGLVVAVFPVDCEFDTATIYVIELLKTSQERRPVRMIRLILHEGQFYFHIGNVFG